MNLRFEGWQHTTIAQMGCVIIPQFVSDYKKTVLVYTDLKNTYFMSIFFTYAFTQVSLVAELKGFM